MVERFSGNIIEITKILNGKMKIKIGEIKWKI